MIKTLAIIAAAATAGIVVSKLVQQRKPRPVRVKSPYHDGGKIRKLRQDPGTGEYYAEE